MGTTSKTKHSARIGQPLPSIDLKDGQGNAVHLEDFREKKLIVAVLDLECSFCHTKLDELKQWQSRRSIMNVEIVAVIREHPLLPSGAGQHITGSFLVLFGCQTQLRERLGIVRVPTLLFLNEQGILQRREVGYRSLNPSSHLL